MYSSWNISCLLTSIAIISLFATKSTTGLVPGEITFLILSQNNSYHMGLAEKLQQSIIEQSLHKENTTHNIPKVFLTYRNFKTTTSSWAIIPALLDIYQTTQQDVATINTKWLILCEEHTKVNLSSLMENLKNENFQKEVYFGYPLYDRQSTIIHHFAFFDNPTSFKYPYLRAGVVFSVPLLKKLLFRLMNTQFSYDFFIDASHELAMFVWNEGKGEKLISRSSYICEKYEEKCSLYAASVSDCNGVVDLNRILFAVKTCDSFHSTRVPVILNTWTRYVKHLRIFSNLKDSQIPTIDIGVPNTKTGHCEKTMEIFRYVHRELSRNESLRDIEWIFLADDDTILSVSALTKHLSCYTAQSNLYLGERYGYHLLSNNGYNYITGGGGIVINLKVLQTLVKSCQCPSPTSPDDMIIATCLHLENIEPIHSPLFKQARTVDYPPQILTDSTISFHKHWQINPYRVYEKWFQQNDKEFYEQHEQKKLLKNNFHKNSDENLLEFERKNENNQYLQQNVDDVFKHSDL